MIQTYEATYENGVVRLPAGIHLPEKTKVYIVVPEMDSTPAYRVFSPRLVHSGDAADFVKEVSEEDGDAKL